MTLFSSKALCTMVILVGCCLIGSPSALASKSKIIEELLSIFGTSSKSPKHRQAPVKRSEQLSDNPTELPGKPPKFPIELLNLRNLPEDDFTKRLIGILGEYGDLSFFLRVQVDAVWSEKIFPAVEAKWKFDPNNMSPMQQEAFLKEVEPILKRICDRENIRSTLRSSKQEDLPQNLIEFIFELGLDKTDKKFFGDALFIAKLANPELTRKDVLCLLRTKVNEKMLDQVASTWGNFAPLRTCLKVILKNAPSVNNCR